MDKFKIAIFGTGRRGKEIHGVLRQIFQIEEIVFIDNYPRETFVNGTQVILAKKFLGSDISKEYIYIVGGKFQTEMLEQLQNARVKNTSIYTLEMFIEKFYHSEIVDENNNRIIKQKKLVILDCSEGFVLGGVERWSFFMSNEFSKRNIDTLLYTNTLEYSAPEDFLDRVLFVPFENEFININEQIKRISRIVEQYSEITFVASHIAIFLCMAVLIKKRNLHLNIKIVSVIHSSMDEEVDANILAYRSIDKYLCVNQQICHKLKNLEYIKHKVFYKETPILCEELNRTYTLSRQFAIKIGYAARLESEHKRSQLLCNVLNALEVQKCNYYMEIAGDGSCYGIIHKYIEEKNLHNKVKLLGRLDYTRMPEFWRKQDIAISLSETEGCSLSMLESMAAGVVNVITHTLGCEEFVIDGKTGFLVSVDCVEDIAKKIGELEKRRELLCKVGEAANALICQKCSMEDYMEFWINQIL